MTIDELIENLSRIKHTGQDKVLIRIDNTLFDIDELYEMKEIYDGEACEQSCIIRVDNKKS